MKKESKFLDYIKIILVEIVAFFLFLFFLKIESIWIVIAAILLAILIYFLSKIYKEKFRALIELFSRYQNFAIGVLFILLIIYPFISPLIITHSTYWMLILIQTGIYIMIALGLNFQLGSTGMMNLATAAFYGIGAYTAGLLALKLGWTALLTIPLGGLAAAFAGLLLVIPIYRTKGHYLALVTLAFGFMLVLAADNIEIIGGPQGLKNIPPVNIFGYNFLTEIGSLHFYTNYYYLVLAILGITIFIFARLFNSWIGLTSAYIRDDEPAAKGCGININLRKLLVFVFGNFFMGVAGAIYAHMIGFISPPNFQFAQSLLIVAIVIIGGMDNILGVIVAAILLVVFPEKLRVVTEYRIFLYGILLVVTLILRPRGILPFGPRKYDSSILKFARKGGS
ncbi:MAG: branched-chain amino acid ABC transporter permease [Candidatus Aenigmarchaeota archaeon]|nr:branched-chain amino acid ABC transporter permease [Candidatus Aenigmarchaeota archaeon]